MKKDSVAILNPRTDPQVNQMKSRVESMCRVAIATQIVSQKNYDSAVANRLQLQQMLRNIDELFEPMRIAAHNAYKAVLITKGSLHDPVEAAIKQTSRDIVTWEELQERSREEARQHKQAEADRAAAEKRQRDIRNAKKRGDNERVEQLEDAPLEVEEVEVEETYQKNSGVSRRRIYRGEVTDLLALVKFVAKNKHFIHLLSPNMSAINTLAKDQKGMLSIPGLKSTSSTSLATIRRDDD